MDFLLACDVSDNVVQVLSGPFLIGLIELEKHGFDYDDLNIFYKFCFLKVSQQNVIPQSILTPVFPKILSYYNFKIENLNFVLY